ncbi:unnamed protein product [Prunus armeniaca]|uniref:KEN domain-containing protein n=1 Tax=Prunus armeniaca TaxID=36596 RepID=A0A6J5XXR4_PRUAR|nr:unnamed protein product [Prunus armeniaca]
MDAKAGTKLSVEEIFRLNIKLTDKRILRPWMYTFCKQKSFNDELCSEAERKMVKGWWSLCYEKFDNTLPEWLAKLQNKEICDPDKLNFNVGNKCLSDFWRDTIRELIEAIAYIHDCGLFHGSLKVSGNYVVVGEQVKLCNIGGCLNSLRIHDQHSRKIQDFKDLRDTLKKFLTMGRIKWPERDSFLKCFDDLAKLDGCGKYVEKLKKHPFLLTPYERVKHIVGIYYDDKFSVEDELNHNDNFNMFRGWTRDRHKLEPFLRKILETGKGKSYSNQPSELLKFLRNTYHHYRRYSDKKECINIEHVDTIFRTRWVDFFDRIHLIS